MNDRSCNPDIVIRMKKIVNIFSPSDAQLKQLDSELTKELESMQHEALKRATLTLGWDVTLQSLHGKIGGKNITYANCDKNSYANFQEFFATWLRGFNELCTLRNVKRWDGGSLSDILTLLSDDFIREYTEIFLERNFIRNYNARVRLKPDEALWKIWFGNQLPYGLLIAPAPAEDGTVRIDKSEIRRASYNYWTIGHVGTTGLYMPDVNKFQKFNSVANFLQFYESVLMRLSSSDYEKGIFQRYISYLKQSTDYNAEPLLIPELKYEGYGKDCGYRLDFTVLNPYTFQFVGFELSPSSTHMYVSGIGSGKTQTQMNQELAKRWEKEMDKRNKYLQKYGISLVTFTDKDLQNLDYCFEHIAKVLRARSAQPVNLQVEQLRLSELINS